jgi:hypothetical protein
MPSRNFVREIKAENIKDINPLDIIYLALKDGSIVLISDNDEETIDYEDTKSIESSSQRISNKNFYNRNYNRTNNQTKTSSSHIRENDKNYNSNKYLNYTRNKTKINTSYSTDKAENRRKIITSNDRYRNDKKYNCSEYKITDNDSMNRSTNFRKNSYNCDMIKSDPNINYKIRNEKLDKSFDKINLPPRRNHVIYNNNRNDNNNNNYNKTNTSFHSIKVDNRIDEQNKSARNYYTKKDTNNNVRIKISNTSISKTPLRRDSQGYKYDNNMRYNNIVEISNLSSNLCENVMNKTVQYEKTDIYNKRFNNINNSNNNNKSNTNYIQINSFNRGKQIRSQSSSNINNRNPQTPNKYFVNRKEMEIMGRIANYGNSYKLLDHGHPNTLFDPKCPHCEDLARRNKLSLSHIKEESIFDNHSFVAIFGDSERSKGRSVKKLDRHYYKVN